MFLSFMLSLDMIVSVYLMITLLSILHTKKIRKKRESIKKSRKKLLTLVNNNFNF